MADWRTDLLQRLGVPRRANSLTALDLWSRSEASPVQGHNPLGARVYVFAQHRFSNLGEPQTFPSTGAAVAYYKRVLDDSGMRVIAIALGSAVSLESIWTAINGAHWRPADYQSGKYPVLLYRQAVAPILTGVPPVVPLSQLSHDLFNAWHGLSHELHHHSARQLARARHWSRRMHSAVK